MRKLMTLAMLMMVSLTPIDQIINEKLKNNNHEN